MVDTTIGAIDLVVYSGPQTIDLQLDVGPTGDRGSKIFTGLGNPNVISVGQDIKYDDLYINTTSGPENSYVYKFVAEEGTDGQWTPIVKLIPSTYNKIKTLNFVNGQTTLIIPKTDIVIDSSTYTVDNFIVRYSIENSNVVASSISSISYSNQNLSITIKALEYSGTWGNLQGNKKIHFYVSVGE
jgi:hypothetical protein